MRHWTAIAILLLGCGASAPRHDAIPLGMDSFALAARYGSPSGYQHQGDYFQLNYGSEAAGCQVIALLDQAQRVAGWASRGARCDELPHRPNIP